MSKFTPGPWSAECVGSTSVGPDAVDVYEITNGHTRIAEFVSANDARLIAAAPEMYEALTALMGNAHISLDDVIYQVRENEGMGWDGPSVQKWADALAKARAALAKVDA